MLLPWSILPTRHDTKAANRRANRTASTKKNRRRESTPLKIETLEDRTVPSASIPLDFANWAPVGPAPILNGIAVPGTPPVSGRVTGLAAHPTNANILYLGAAGGGVWKSTNAGQSWTPLTDINAVDGGNVTAPPPLHQLFVGALAISRSNPSVVVAGTGEGNNADPNNNPGGYVGTFYGRGVLVSLDAGNSWRLLRGNNVGGIFQFDRMTITQVVIDPTDERRVYVSVSDSGNNTRFNQGTGARGTGVYRCDDITAATPTWVNLTDTEIGPQTTRDGAPTPADDITERSVNTSFTDIVMDPFDPQILYAAIGEANGSRLNGIYKTTNARAASPTWTRLSGAIANNTYPLANGPAAGDFPAPGRMEPQFGGTFRWVPHVGVIKLAIGGRPQDRGILYAAFQSLDDRDIYQGSAKVYKTTNSGTNWRFLPTVTGFAGFQASYDLTVDIDPNNPNRVILGGAIADVERGVFVGGIIQSTDGGNNWYDIVVGQDGNGPHPDMHAHNARGTFDANGRYLSGNDGGVWRLDNPNLGVIKWSNLNSNLQLTQFIGISLHPTNPNIAFGGSQDNGTSRFEGSLGWQMVEGGDGGVVRVDQNRPNVVYHTFTGASVRRSEDGGDTWVTRTQGITQAGPFSETKFYVPYVIDKSVFDPFDDRRARLVLGTDILNESLNRADSWNAIGDLNGLLGVGGPMYPDVFFPLFPLRGFAIDAVAVAPSNSSTIYASAGGRVFITRDANLGRTASYRDINPLGFGPIIPPGPGGPQDNADHSVEWADIVVDPSNDGRAYAVMANFRDNNGDGVDDYQSQVWMTTNYGTAWTPVATGSLPNLPVWSVELDIQDPSTTLDDIVYIGTDDGVYRIVNPAGGTWQRLGNGLPRVQVVDLELNKQTGILAAGTHGRGMWQLQVRDPFVVSSTPSGFGSAAIDHLDFTFDQPMDGPSFSITDVLRFVRVNPDTSVDNLLGLVTGVSQLNPTTFRVSFTSQSLPGEYQMTIGPDRNLPGSGIFAATGTAFSPAIFNMDQDRDGTPGEGFDSAVPINQFPNPGDAYTARTTITVPLTIRVDALGGGDYTTIQEAVAAAAANPGPDNIIVYGNGSLSSTIPYTVIDLGVSGTQHLIVQGDNITFTSKTIGGADAPLVVKFLHTILDIGANSRLRIEGSANANVIFTSWVDDTVGGDTNGDGSNSAPNRKDWGGVRFRGSAVDQGPDQTTGAFINYLDIRYTGETLLDPDPSRAGQLTEFSSVKMEFDGTDAAQIRVWNTIFQHGGKAFDVDFRALEGRGPDIGNGNGVDPTLADGTAVVAGVGRQPVTMNDNSINGLFVNIPVQGQNNIPPLDFVSRWDDVSVTYVLTQRLIVTGTLQIDQGMTIKTDRNAIDATAENAHIYVNGKPEQKVYFTSLTDDYFNPAYADGSNGDTNNDNTTTNQQPAAGDWGGIRVGDGHIDYAVFRYGGGVVPFTGVGNGFINHSPLAILTRDYTTSAGPYQRFRVSNSEFTDTFRGIIDGTLYNSAAITAGVDPLTQLVDVFSFRTFTVGEIQVIDNYIHDNLGRAIETAPNVYNDRANSLGGYGIHFRRNVLTANEVNGIYTIWSHSNFGAGATPVAVSSRFLGMPLKAYMDDTDIVQTIPLLPDNQGLPDVNQILITDTDQVLQMMSRRDVSPVNSFLDKFSGVGSGSTSAFQSFLNVLTNQKVQPGPLPANGDNGLFYYRIDFENTARGVPITGVSQTAAGNLRGDEWRDWGVNFVTTGAGTFPLKARANVVGDPDFITPVSPTNVLSSANGNNGSFEMIFPNQVSALGFWVVDNEVTSSNEGIEFYDANNNLLERIGLPVTTSGPVFVGRVSKAPIYRVVIREDANDQLGSQKTGSVSANTLNGNTYTTPPTMLSGLPANITSIDDINVQLKINHTQARELKIELISPTGQAVLLKDSNASGTAGADFRDTIFDDQGLIDINLGAPPYVGNFRPTQNLSRIFNPADPNFGGNFNPNSAAGWKLRITDLAGGGTGTLVSWNMTFHTTGAGALPDDAMGIDDLYYVDAGQSLVVKVEGPDNGVTVGGFDGKAMESGGLAVGGTLRVMGQPRNPIQFTSYADDSVGAGTVGNRQFDTNNDGSSTTGVAGSWRGLQILPGANSSRIENQVQVGGTLVRTSSDLNPYTIGDEPGSATDLLESGTRVNVQDGTLIEHSDIRFALVGIEAHGYPDGKLAIDGYEIENNDTRDGASPLRPFMINSFGEQVFSTPNGAVRLGAIMGGEKGGDPIDNLDYYSIPEPLAGIQLVVEIEKTSNDSTAGPAQIAIFNYNQQLLYWNNFGASAPNPLDPNGPPVQGTGNFIGPFNVLPGDNDHLPFYDAQYIVVAGRGTIPNILTDPQTVLVPIPNGEGFRVMYVDSNGVPQDIPQDDTWTPPGFGTQFGGYEIEVRPFRSGVVLKENRDFTFERNTEGEIIIRQNLIRDYAQQGIFLHDTVINMDVRRGDTTFEIAVPAQVARYGYRVPVIDTGTGQPTWNSKILIPGLAVYNNVIRDGAGTGIQITSDPNNQIPDVDPNPPGTNASVNLPEPTPYHTILNNTIHNVQGSGIQERSRGGSIILNNIATNNSVGIGVTDIGDVDPGFRQISQATVGYNLLFQNAQDFGTGTLGNVSASNNKTGQNPLYVDVATRDLRIFGNSPAVDQSLSDLPDRLLAARQPDEPTRAPSDDFRDRARVDNVTRQNASTGSFPFYDIGALESSEPSLRVISLSLFTSTGILGGPIATFQVEFSGRVDPSTITTSTVRVLRGTTNQAITGISNSYDPVRDVHQFSFTFATPLLDGSYSVSLDGVSTGASDPAIRDIAGQILDGEFDGVSFPSGNSVPGGTFLYNFIVQTSEIGDLVWQDTNGNAIREGGEPGIQGVRLTIVGAGPNGVFGDSDDITNIPARVTDANGNYKFSSIQPGIFRVSVDPNSLPPNFLLTTGNEPLTVTIGVGQKVVDADFGFRLDLQNARIGDLVWDDLDGDGLRDTTPFVEPGLANVEVQLRGWGRDRIFGTADDIVQTQTTNSAGAYQFSNLPGGRYRILVNPATVPAGYGLTTGNQPLPNGLEIDLNPGQVVGTADFGYQLRNSSVTGNIFNDNDNSGSFTAGDTPASGVTAYLDLDGDSVLDAGEPFAVTDPSGIYTIAGLGAGTFTLRIVTPVGFAVTTPVPPFHTITFPDGNTTVGDNGTVGDIGDFGIFLDPVTAAIGDRVFEDVNGNGVDDDGVGIANVRVFVDANNNGTWQAGEPNAFSNASGDYFITGLAAGTYNVRIDTTTLPAGPNWVRTTPTSLPLVVTLAPAQVFTDADFGFQDRRGQITGVVFDDLNGSTTLDGFEPGRFAGVQIWDDLNDNGSIDIGEAVDVTNASGVYTLSNLGVGVHRVKIAAGAPIGYQQTTPTPLIVNINFSTEVASGQNIGFRETNGQVRGQVFNDQDGDGFRDPTEGLGVVGVRVFVDLNSNTTFDAGEPFATTDGGGNYTITGVPSSQGQPGNVWNVYVDNIPAGATVTTANPVQVNLPDGHSTVTGVDFGVTGVQGGVFYLTVTGGTTLRNSNGSTLAMTNVDIVKLTVNSDGSYFYSMYFDGSDVGLTPGTEQIDAFTFLPNGDILISTVGAVSVRANYNSPGVGSGSTISGSGEDILRFRPTGVGLSTRGSWLNFNGTGPGLYFDGSSRGLSGASENTDAISVLSDGRILISTTGTVSVPGQSNRTNRDILAFDPATNGWSLYFEGADVGLSASSENIDAIHVGNPAASLPTLYLSTTGNFSVPGASGRREDAVAFSPTSLGSTTSGTFGPGLALDGSTVGLANFNVTGLFLGTAPGPFPLQAGGTVSISSHGHQDLSFRWAESITTLNVFVDNANGQFDADEVARVRDALVGLDGTLQAASGPRLVEISDPRQADIIIRSASSSVLGSQGDGVLGTAVVTYDVGIAGWLDDGSSYRELTGRTLGTPVHVVLIDGWNWYAGADASGIGADQYDLQSVAAHELGHAVGLADVGSDADSVMFESLLAGQVRRDYGATDVAALERLYGAELPPVGDVTVTADQVAAAVVGGKGGQATEVTDPIVFQLVNRLRNSAPAVRTAGGTETLATRSPAGSNGRRAADRSAADVLFAGSTSRRGGRNTAARAESLGLDSGWLNGLPS